MNNNYWNNEEYNRVHGTGSDGPDPAESHPVTSAGTRLAVVATALGIASIVTTFVMPIIVPGVLGAIAIVLAIISSGREPKMPRSSWVAMWFGIAGVGVYVAFMITAGTLVYKTFTDPTTRAQMNSIMEQVYGYSFDDMIKELEQQYESDLNEVSPDTGIEQFYQNDGPSIDLYQNDRAATEILQEVDA